MRRRQHGQLRRVLKLRSVPDDTTRYRFRKRRDDQNIDQALGEAARRLGTVGGRRRHRARVAVDATGRAPGTAISTFFVRRSDPHRNQPLPWRHGLPWLAVVDLERQLILAPAARRGPWNDGARLPPLLEAARHAAGLGQVLADTAFDSERNHAYVRQQLRARSLIPAQRGQKSWRIHGVRAAMRRAFLRRQYSRRALLETLFSTVKRKLSARAPGRSLFLQACQALLLGLAYHLSRL